MIKLIIALFLSLVSTAVLASKIIDKNDQVVCQQCGNNTVDIVVKNTNEASNYTLTSTIETPDYAFIREDMGTSCPSGGWYAIDKTENHPKAKQFATGSCDEFEVRKTWKARKTTYLKVQYYNPKKGNFSGKTRTFEFH
ncbi:MAG: hypothetical protein LBI71_10335 [Enterobacteriaceae bacterium]|jgi:hypothetical protein|nr:hypothetical protein [Enterobacteriaceae bacterium]